MDEFLGIPIYIEDATFTEINFTSKMGEQLLPFIGRTDILRSAYGKWTLADVSCAYEPTVWEHPDWQSGWGDPRLYGIVSEPLEYHQVWKGTLIKK